MMKRTVALTILGALLALSFSGCALTYSKTRVSGCKVVTECGLLGGLVKLHKSEKPLGLDCCPKASDCSKAAAGCPTTAATCPTTASAGVKSGPKAAPAGQAGACCPATK